MLSAAAAVLLAGAWSAPPLRALDWRKVGETAQKAKELKEELHLGKANEVALGREVGAYLIAKYGIYDGEDLTRYVGLVGRTVARGVQRRDIQYRFGILNTKSVNAYSAPGGYVFVSRGLLQRLRNEAQLAGVLAHEIVHVDRRHAVKGFVKARALQELGDRVGGGAAAAEVSRSLIKGITETGFSRADEFDADKRALPLLRGAGYTAQGLAAALRRLYGDGKQERSLTEVFKSQHPALDKRLERLGNAAAGESDGAVLGKRYRSRVVF